MMHKKSPGAFARSICSCVLIMLAINHAVAQQQETVLKEQFTAYSRERLQEKLYLHSDKELYVAGEICWFKIYNTDACFNMPLGISKVVYIEVVDKTKKPVLQTKVALNNGTGNGSLQWPVTITSG